MRRTMRILLLAGILSGVLMLAGCSIPRPTLNPENLYSLPTLPAKYTELNIHLNEILADGAEYAAPIAGAYIQSVQMVDLDGDGQEEALAFFRNAGEEKPLKIYVFTADGDTYRQTDLIEGTGTGVYSVAYSDLDGDGRLELLVGWKATVELQVLEVYALRPEGAELLLRSDYVKYTAVDLNQDQKQELVVIRADEEGGSVADYYDWKRGGTLSSQSSARISVTMAELSQQGRVTKGWLKQGVPALFVTGVTTVPRAITDILAVKNGELVNVVLSETTGVSGEIATYCALYPMDINGDNITEVPVPVPMESLDEDRGTHQRVDWYQYDAQGTSGVVMRTYHNLENRWFLRLPDTWMNRIGVSRAVSPDETTITFCILKKDGKGAEPFLRITAITGSSRENRAVRGGRFLLSRQAETIYTAELLPGNKTWRYGVSEDEVRAAFSLITTEWSAGDY